MCQVLKKLCVIAVASYITLTNNGNCRETPKILRKGGIVGCTCMFLVIM